MTRPAARALRLPALRRPAAVWLLAALVAAVYAVLAVQRHRHLHSSAFDLGIFSQTVQAYARLQPPRVPVLGELIGKGPGFLQLGDHWSPVWALLAPTWWVWPHPVTLLVDQALLLGVSVVPVWRFTVRRLGSPVAEVVSVAYAGSWGLAMTAAFDVHEVAFAVPLVALAVERADAGRWRTATACALALLLVKEDMGLLLVAYGAWVALHPGRRRRGALLAAAGVAAYVVTTSLLIPALGGGKDFAYFYGGLGTSLPAALGRLVAHPLDVARLAVDDPAKRTLLRLLLLPVGWLALGSPLVLLALPLLAEQLFSSRPDLWQPVFHHDAVITVVLALAVVDTVAPVRARLDGRRLVLGRVLPVAVAVAALAGTVASTLSPRFDRGLAYLAQPSSWSADAVVRAGRAAVAAVPPGVTVAADARLLPQLVERNAAVLLTGEPVQADWVLADVARPYFPLDDAATVAAIVNDLRRRGWEQVREEQGWVVLCQPLARALGARRCAPAPRTPGAAPPPAPSPAAARAAG